MDGEYFLFVVLILGLVGIPACAVIVETHERHELQMECLKQRGEWVEKTCIFRK